MGEIGGWADIDAAKGGITLVLSVIISGYKSLVNVDIIKNIELAFKRAFFARYLKY